MSKENQYQFIPSNNYLTIKLKGVLDQIDEAAFFKEFNLYFFDPYPHVFLNCEQVSLIAPAWHRVLLKLKQMTREFNRHIFLIRVSDSMKNELKKNGLDTALPMLSNLREALAESGLITKKQLDTDFINPFLSATLKVLEIQANVKAEGKTIHLKKEKDKSYGDVSGIIGIVSDSFNGSVVISFPETTFLKIMSSMLGEECTTLTKEIADGAGELTNMIFGQAKITLNEKGYGIKTALPSVVTGKNHSLATLTTGPIVVVPFTSSVGDFFVEICLSD